MHHVVIIGGGLAGLVSSILLQRQKLNVLLIERKAYPFHRVCGEYISNEVTDFMHRNQLLPEQKLPQINRFQLTSTSGKGTTISLDQGGFGISRYSLDHHLAQLAENEGVEFMTDAVQSITFNNDVHEINTVSGKTITGKIVIGAFGKRSNIDRELDRSFFRRKSPYIGVKYHVRTQHPDDLVALHNFSGGYCGINRIEDDKSNLCYLSSRDNLKQYGSVGEMEKNVLFRNPALAAIFDRSEFLFEKPVVINEISFETKEPVYEHILMCGDAAGMITPLCGNGMAMAIHAAKLVSEAITTYYTKQLDRTQLEQRYKNVWKKMFANRLAYGRAVQRLFGNKVLSGLAVGLVSGNTYLTKRLVRNTHGQPF